MVSNTLETVWRNQRVWSLTASRLKKSIATWRWIVLWLGIGGAVLETLAAQLATYAPQASTVRSVLAWAGAAALAVASVVIGRKLGRYDVREWVRARSASEGLKSEVYRYLTGSGPYAETDRDAKLLARTQETMKRVEDLRRHTATTQASAKEPPPPLNVEEYIERRVNDQINGYYRPTAAKLARRVARFRAAEFVLSLVAAALGVSAAAVPAEAAGAWVAVATTIAGAITAHIAAERYEYLVTTYLATADRLEFLSNQWLVGSGDADAGQFVSSCEAIISVENQAWMAEWTGVAEADSPAKT